jgi:hypothetical protein
MELVRAAVADLQPREREVFELVVRHELPAQEVSDVLGISVAQAHDRLARARTQLEQALGQPDPAALFAAYAAAPFPDVPAELWPRLELKCFDPGLDLERDAILERAGRFDPATGFPRPRDVRRRRRLVVTGVTAVAVAAVAAAIALVVALRPAPVTETPRTVAFTEAPPGVTATAELHDWGWGTQLYLEIDGLEADQRLAVWLERPDGTRVPAGSFLATDGELHMMLGAGANSTDAVALGVSDAQGTTLLLAPLET